MVRKGWMRDQHQNEHWSRFCAPSPNKWAAMITPIPFLATTYRASSIDGSRALHLSRKRQLRMMFASVDAAADCALAAASSEAFLSLSLSCPPLPPSSFWRIRLLFLCSSRHLSSSRESASPASASRTSAAAAATSFNARGGELARSSLHLRVSAEEKGVGKHNYI